MVHGAGQALGKRCARHGEDGGVRDNRAGGAASGAGKGQPCGTAVAPEKYTFET